MRESCSCNENVPKPLTSILRSLKDRGFPSKQKISTPLNQNKSDLDDSLITTIRTKYFKNKLANIKSIIEGLKK